MLFRRPHTFVQIVYLCDTCLVPQNAISNFHTMLLAVYVHDPVLMFS